MVIVPVKKRCLKFEFRQIFQIRCLRINGSAQLLQHPQRLFPLFCTVGQIPQCPHMQKTHPVAELHLVFQCPLHNLFRVLILVINQKYSCSVQIWFIIPRININRTIIIIHYPLSISHLKVRLLADQISRIIFPVQRKDLLALVHGFLTFFHGKPSLCQIAHRPQAVIHICIFILCPLQHLHCRSIFFGFGQANAKKQTGSPFSAEPFLRLFASVIFCSFDHGQP